MDGQQRAAAAGWRVEVPAWVSVTIMFMLIHGRNGGVTLVINVLEGVGASYNIFISLVINNPLID